MLKRKLGFGAAAIACLALTLSVVTSSTRAQASGGVLTSVAPATVVRHTFTIAPGHSDAFPMPVAGKPVHVDVSVNFTNGTTVSPTELMSALIEQNPTTGVITFIGTNSDGTVAANNTNFSTVMSSLLVPGQLTPDAILIVTTPPPFQLGIYQYPQTTTSGTYTVTLTY